MFSPIFLHPGPKLAALVVAAVAVTAAVGAKMEVTPLQSVSVRLLAAAAVPALEALTLLFEGVESIKRNSHSHI